MAKKCLANTSLEDCYYIELNTQSHVPEEQDYSNPNIYTAEKPSSQWDSAVLAWVAAEVAGSKAAELAQSQNKLGPL